METWLIGIILGLLVFTAISFYMQYVQQWVEVAASSGHQPDATLRAFATLKANGVRCRLQQSGGSAAWSMLGGSSVTQSLLVHKGDVKKARPLVAEALHEV